MNLTYKTKTRKEFLDLNQMGAFTRIVATQDVITKNWRLFGLGKNGVAVFVEKARGGVREWSGLNYLADFCAALGIRIWEVHMPRVNPQK